MTASERQKTQSGPDFFCIGAQKAGTGWLYEQLRSHPDFWMPPMKELHYFDRLASFGDATPQRTLPFARKEEDRAKIARQRVRDDRDRDFLDRLERLRQESIDFEAYADLFGPRGALISGDITPGYSILNDTAVRAIAGRFPTAKVIFIARDPVERAWSQLSMYVRRGLIEPFAPDDLDRIAQHLRRPEILARSYPSKIVGRWRQQVKPDLFRVYFFDDLKRNPVNLRASIVTFLGGDPQKPSGALPPDHNAKAEKQKLSLTESGRVHLAKFFKEELQKCAAELGGPAIEWPRRYGL